MAEAGTGQFVQTVGHTRGQGIAYQIAVSRATGGVLTEDGEFLAQTILQESGVSSADLTADGIGLLVTVDLPNGALFQRHERESAVDHTACGSVTVICQG